MNAVNLPMFANGSGAFLGDYIDVAGQTIVATGDSTAPFKFNVGGNPTNAYTTGGRAPEFHVAFTDNRNVIPPKDGNWVTPTCNTSSFTKDASGNVTGVNSATAAAARASPAIATRTSSRRSSPTLGRLRGRQFQAARVDRRAPSPSRSRT